MNNQSTEDTGLVATLAFLGGAAAGIMVGLLLAPRSGKDTRREIKGYARKTEDEVIERAKEARVALDEVINRGRQFVDERRADVEAALEAGREALRERRER